MTTPKAPESPVRPHDHYENPWLSAMAWIEYANALEAENTRLKAELEALREGAHWVDATKTLPDNSEHRPLSTIILGVESGNNNVGLYRYWHRHQSFRRLVAIPGWPKNVELRLWMPWPTFERVLSEPKP